MKKTIALFTVMTILLSTTFSYGAEYKDIKSSNWAYPAVNAMSEKAVISGYPDGSFRPNNTVTYGEFIKMALIAATGEDVGNSATGNWATEYYNKAKELGYYTEYDINKSKLTKQITRAHMALIISSIVGDVEIDKYDEIQKGITDITYKTPYEYDITKAYATGILTGYTDNTFQPDKTLTRAEAATVIHRLMDENKRVLPHGEEQDDTQTTKPLEQIITNYKNVISKNGVHDTMMAEAKSYEFVNDGTQYGLTIHENQGTTWINVPKSADDVLGRLYSMKDGKIIELLRQSANPKGGATAIYYYDITKVDYIISLDVDRHVLIISNPFKK
jgi:hypothetical protein